MTEVVAMVGMGRGFGLLWMALLCVTGVGLSRVFACVTPFAALTVLAAFTLRRREAALVVAFVWAANQAVGFGLLGYPADPATIGWGLAIGLGAAAGLAAALAGRSIVPMREAALALCLLLAFGAYEAVLLVATLWLPSGPGAFAPSVLAQMLALNAAVAVALYVPFRLAGADGQALVAQS